MPKNMIRQGIAVLLCACLVAVSGCATSMDTTTQLGATHVPNELPATVATLEILTSTGTPVRITRISVPHSAPGYGNAQVANGAAWATQPSMSGSHKTIKVDTHSYQVAQYSRPFSAGAADLLVDEHAIWYSDGMTRLVGRGYLYRIDSHTDKLIAKIEGVGTPFASAEGTIWTFNPRTRIVSGVDANSNSIHTRLIANGGAYNESFAFAAESIWQLAFEEDVSAWQLASGKIPSSVVRRIDLRTNGVTAEIRLGPFLASDRIRFVNESIWILGERDNRGDAYAIRIDVTTNRIAATIPLTRSMEHACAEHAYPKTPVLFKGAIWVSTFCTDVGRMPSVLLRIDGDTDKVTDEIHLSESMGQYGQTSLAAGDDAMWGFDRHSAIRIDF